PRVAFDEGVHRLADHPFDEAAHAQQRLADAVEILVAVSFHGSRMIAGSESVGGDEKEGGEAVLQRWTSPPGGRSEVELVLEADLVVGFARRVVLDLAEVELELVVVLVPVVAEREA